MFNKFKKSCITITIFFTLIPAAYASATISPIYTPGGALSNLSVFDIYNPMSTLTGPGWWYFVGLLNDQQKQMHSLQVVITRANFEDTNMLGIGSLGFTFKSLHGNNLYLWNLYPDLNSLVHYSIAPLYFNAAKENNFKVGLQSDANDQFNPFLYEFSHEPADTKHAVGQIGSRYFLTANGFGEIGANQHNSQLVQYRLKLTVKDQRGMLPEGEGGFVSSDLVNSKSMNFNNSWEFATPNLRVLQWEMTITPIGKITPQSPLQQTMVFHNDSSKDHIWLDRQILNNSTNAPDTSSSAINELVQQKILHENPQNMMNTPEKPLYHGTWMSFCLNKKPLNGICGVAVALWNNDVTTVSMDTAINAEGGFMNLFTPDSNGKGFPLRVGSTETELLSIQGQNKDLPYRIQNDPTETFQSPLSNHVYAQRVYVTLNKGTVFSSILNSFTHQENSNKSYVLEFQAISKQAENVMVSYDNAYYEGAAIVSLCSQSRDQCHPVGTGFMEQMGYNN